MLCGTMVDLGESDWSILNKIKVHRNYPKRLSESESGKITQHIDAGVDGIGQILGEFQKI